MGRGMISLVYLFNQLSFRYEKPGVLDLSGIRLRLDDRVHGVRRRWGNMSRSCLDMTRILLILIPSFKFEPKSCFEYLNCFRCYKVNSACKIPLWYLVKKALQRKTWMWWSLLLDLDRRLDGFLRGKPYWSSLHLLPSGSCCGFTKFLQNLLPQWKVIMNDWNFHI